MNKIFRKNFVFNYFHPSVQIRGEEMLRPITKRTCRVYCQTCHKEINPKKFRCDMITPRVKGDPISYKQHCTCKNNF